MSDEQKQVVFDVVKAGFYLIASLLAFQCAVIFLVVTSCIYYKVSIMGPVAPLDMASPCNNVRDQLQDLMLNGLAAALAFVGGRNVPNHPTDKS
jgi:hypothetical protein